MLFVDATSCSIYLLCMPNELHNPSNNYSNTTSCLIVGDKSKASTSDITSIQRGYWVFKNTYICYWHLETNTEFVLK